MNAIIIRMCTNLGGGGGGGGGRILPSDMRILNLLTNYPTKLHEILQEILLPKISV